MNEKGYDKRSGYKHLILSEMTWILNVLGIIDNQQNVNVLNPDNLEFIT